MDQKKRERAIGSLGVRSTEVHVKLFPNGTGVPTYTSYADTVASVARGATGVFNIVLRDPQYAVADVQATYVSGSDSEDIYAQGGTIAPLASSVAPTIQVKLKTGSSNVDVTADAGKYVSVRVLFEDEDTVIVSG